MLLEGVQTERAACLIGEKLRLAVAEPISWQDKTITATLSIGVYLHNAGETTDAFMLLGFVLFMIGITVYQEGKTENALEALRDLSSPRALVIRDGGKKRIPGREVVVGDLIILNPPSTLFTRPSGNGTGGGGPFGGGG